MVLPESTLTGSVFNSTAGEYSQWSTSLSRVIMEYSQQNTEYSLSRVLLEYSQQSAVDYLSTQQSTTGVLSAEYYCSTLSRVLLQYSQPQQSTTVLLQSCFCKSLGALYGHGVSADILTRFSEFSG